MIFKSIKVDQNDIDLIKEIKQNDSLLYNSTFILDFSRLSSFISYSINEIINFIIHIEDNSKKLKKVRSVEKKLNIELEKINKVIDNQIEGGATETLLVVDATTGQNGISQAKAFKEITNITGIVLTKLDGTAKGGIVLAIKESVGIPVKYIGLGETKDDLQVFDIEKYIYGLFKDMM